MKLNDFEVLIPEGDETEEGYICLKHETQYSIKLRNHSERLRCNAAVKIDGRSVGTWRVDRSDAITIERPVHDSGRFTFYQEGTPEAAKANIKPTDELGLVSVLFRPEKEKQAPLYMAAPFIQRMAGPRPYAAGGTGLSGKSAQQFDDAEEIEIDDEKAVTIHLRLVAIQNEPRPLFALETPIPPAMQSWTDDSSGSDKISKSIRSPAESRLSWKLASLGVCLLIAYIAYLHFSIRTHHGNATHEPIIASMADDQIPVPQSVSQSPEAMFKRAKSENNEYSFSFYSNAAERGHAPSQVELGLYYVLGKPPVEKDFNKGIKLIESAAKGGHLEAQVTLGEILTQTHSASSNRAEGRKWLYEAANRGDLKALYLIGSLYDAHTTDNDGVLSFSLMRIAINKGYSGSLERYAAIASNMSEADKRLAVELEEKAMKLGVQQWSLNWLESEREKQVQQLSVQVGQNVDTSSRWTPVLKDWVTSEGKVIRALFVDLQDNGLVLEIPGTGGRIYRPLSRLSLQGTSGNLISAGEAFAGRNLEPLRGA